MNTACIIIIVLIIVILLLLLCSYFLWWNKPKNQLEKTNGSSNIKIYGYVNIPVYLNTTVETYLSVIYNEKNGTVDIIFKTGGLSEKGNEYVFNKEMLTIDRTYDELYSHIPNIKKLSRIINKQLFWHHVCMFNSFGEFQNVRNYNNKDIEAGSSSLSGLLEIICHYIALDILYKYCEDQIILISDNNFDKIEYDDNVGLYESVASMLNGGTNKLKKASFIRNIKQFTNIDINLEFYIARFKNTDNIKGKIDDIIGNIISRSNAVLKKLFEIDNIAEINDEEKFSEFNKIKLLFNITSDEKLINHICDKSRPRNTDHDTFMSLIHKAKQAMNPQLELKTYATDVSIIRTTFDDAYPSLDATIRKFHNIENNDNINQLLIESKDVNRYDSMLVDKPASNMELITRLQTLYNSSIGQQLGTTYEQLYKSEEILCYAIYYIISNITQNNYIDDRTLAALTNNLYAMQDSKFVERYYLTDCYDKLLYGYILYAKITNNDYKNMVLDLLDHTIRSEFYDDYIDIFSLIIDTNETGINRYIEKSFEDLSMFIDNLNDITDTNEDIGKSSEKDFIQHVKQKLSTINDFANAAQQLMELQLGDLEESVIEFEDSYIFDDEFNEEDVVKYFTDLLFKYIYIKQYIEENGEEDKVNRLKTFVIEKVDNQISYLFSFANEPPVPKASELINLLHKFIGLLDMVINIIDSCCSDISNECLNTLLAYIDSHCDVFMDDDFNCDSIEYETYINRINNIVTLYRLTECDGILYDTGIIIDQLDEQFDSLFDSFIQSHKFIEFFNIVFGYYVDNYIASSPDVEYIENVKNILTFIESHNNSNVYNPILEYLNESADHLRDLPCYINIYNIICISITTTIVNTYQSMPEDKRGKISSIELVVDPPSSNSNEETILRYKQSILNSCLFILEKQDQEYGNIYNDVVDLISDTINYSGSDSSITKTINNFMIAFKSVFYYILVNSINDARVIIRQTGEAKGSLYAQYKGFYDAFINTVPQKSYTNIKDLFNNALQEPEPLPEQPAQPV